ncbi:MAG TPA: ATP-binding protein [Gemmatimonadales bacterium]|nr:ATP-binding protein [Gemmatimonadales bacterium]
MGAAAVLSAGAFFLTGALVGFAATCFVTPVPLGLADLADSAVATRLAAAALVATVVLVGIRRERRAARSSERATDEAGTARAAAAAERAQLEALFAGAPAGLAHIDAERRFARANAAFLELLGIPGEELLGRPAGELPANLREALEPGLERAYGGERTSRIEVSLERPGHRGPMYAIASVFPLPTTGTGREVAVVLQDVTALRSAERRLRRGQRMEAIGRIADGIAHEVNNQLALILAGSQLLGHRGARPGDPALDAIERAAERATQVIGRLLAYTRQQGVQLRPTRLDALLAEAAPELAEALGPQIDLLVRSDPAVQWIDADAEQLTCALAHLAANARDAMPNGGRLLIETEVVEVSASGLAEDPGVQVRPGRYARITVSDCGVGMAPQVRGRAFEPFFTTKPPADGNGLGLSFVYAVVKQLGGYVWLDSTPGAGTTVRIDLPLMPNGAEEPAALADGVAQSPPCARKGPLALGCDDAPAWGPHA